MRGRSDAARAIIHLGGIGLHVSDELLEILNRKILLRDHQHRRSRGVHDRLEVGTRIIGQLWVETDACRLRSKVAHQQRIAIGLSLRDSGDADRTAGASDVLDHELLAERAAHVIGHEAGHHVGRPTGCEGDHQRDRSCGIAPLGLGSSCNEAEGRGESEKIAFHGFPSL
jgi:hypothetical protein